ncbi:MAG: MMPL family transporter [Chloroflexi bacterium]|nr:MMPL family transporter [Chloroflexota bacterium]
MRRFARRVQSLRAGRALPVPELSLGGLAAHCARNPWRTVGIWAAMLVAASALVATQLGGSLTTDQRISNNPDYARGDRIIAERFDRPGGVTELVIVQAESSTVDEPSFRTVVEQLQADLAALGPATVQGVFSYYQTGDPSLVSQDRQSLLLPVLMSGDLEDAIVNVHEVHAVVDALEAEGFTTHVTGRATGGQDFREIAERDLQKGELVALPIAFLILVLVFGAFAAALLPIVLAGVAIVIALGVTALIGQVFDLSFFVVNMVTMMGLAVGIDYSLFVVSRYREERRAGRDTVDAIRTMGATASRAVLISGLVVIVALLGLLVIPVNVFQGLAAGAILVVAAAVFAALTLLPAILSLMGDHVDAFRLPFLGRLAAAANRRRGRPLWDRLAYAVMRRPIVSLVIVGGLLAAAAVPNIGINTGSSSLSSLPTGTRTHDGLAVLQRDFLGGLVSPAQIVVDGDTSAADVQAAITRMQTALADDPEFGPSRLEISRDGTAALITVPLVAEPTSSAGADAVRRLRDEVIPRALADVEASAFVTGVTAQNVAYFDVARQYTPVVFGIVLSISFVLLLVVFRSLIVPAKAILMNLLAVGAAYGLIVLVSQMGFAADLLGFQKVVAIEAWVPILLFAVLFGLSMDYHVFLLSRIRERFERTGDNAESVAFGLRRTGALITGAALIMVAVFGGFASGDLVVFQQIGFGLAVAVAIDATLIRSILVPASMKLLGSRNWWLPRGLRWLPQVRLEGAIAAPPKPSALLRKRRTP